MTLSVPYNRTQAKRSLILGIAWLFLATSALVLAEDRSLFAGMLPMGLFSLGYAWHLRSRSHFDLMDNEVVVHTFPFITRRYAFSALKEIRYFAGEYILMFGKKELRLDMNLVDADTLPQMKAHFETLRRQIAEMSEVL